MILCGQCSGWSIGPPDKPGPRSNAVRSELTTPRCRATRSPRPARAGSGPRAAGSWSASRCTTRSATASRRPGSTAAKGLRPVRERRGQRSDDLPALRGRHPVGDRGPHVRGDHGRLAPAGRGRRARRCWPGAASGSSTTTPASCTCSTRRPGRPGPRSRSVRPPLSVVTQHGDSGVAQSDGAATGQLARALRLCEVVDDLMQVGDDVSPRGAAPFVSPARPRAPRWPGVPGKWRAAPRLRRLAACRVVAQRSAMGSGGDWRTTVRRRS
jgi:hypothetical protein